MRFSVFGATGFIGRNYIDSFSENCISVDRNKKVSPTQNIINFISTVDNYNIKTDPLLDINTNLVLFMEILDNSRKKWGNDLVFTQISTWFVYGSTELPAKESSPCNPRGAYSITALAREQILRSYCQTFNLNFRILRLGNVIGIGDKKISRKKNALQYMIRELAQGREIELYKNGAIRDYIDVRDCAEAIHLVLEKGNLNETYNIANGKGYNVRDLVEVAWQEAGYTGKINDIPVPEFHKIVQTPKMWMDTKKLKSLGYVQKHDIKQSVRELVHYYQRENEETKNS